MQVSPQKKSSDRKYPKASDVAKKCAVVAAGTLTATTLMGFLYNSDIPSNLGLRADTHQLSEVFTDDDCIGVNASGTRKLHCHVITLGDAISSIGTTKKGELRGFDLTFVVIDKLRLKNLEEGSELYEMVKDYQLYELKYGGVIVLPKDSQHYYILGDSPENYNYTATLRDKYGNAVYYGGSAMVTSDYEITDPLL